MFDDQCRLVEERHPLAAANAQVHGIMQWCFMPCALAASNAQCTIPQLGCEILQGMISTSNRLNFSCFFYSAPSSATVTLLAFDV